MNELGDNLGHADTSVHVGNEIADAIISEKMIKAENAGIVFQVDGDIIDYRKEIGIINIKETVDRYDGEFQIEVVEGENHKYVFQMEIVIPI